MKRLLVITMLAVMVTGTLMLPAGASLTPMAWGMPIMGGSSSLMALRNDAAVMTDNEAASVAFPGTGLCFGAGGGLPSISQTALQSLMLNSVGVTSANQNFFAAYPYFSLGGAPIPSMGFF